MTLVTVVGTGLLATLASVLAGAAASKLRDPAPAGRALAVLSIAGPGPVVRCLAGAELALGAAALVLPARVSGLVLPARVSGLVLSAVFATFSAIHWSTRGRVLDGGCGCFGEQHGRERASPGRQVTLTGSSALAGAVVAALAPRSPMALARASRASRSRSQSWRASPRWAGGSRSVAAR